MSEEKKTRIGADNNRYEVERADINEDDLPVAEMSDIKEYKEEKEKSSIFLDILAGLAIVGLSIGITYAVGIFWGTFTLCTGFGVLFLISLTKSNRSEIYKKSTDSLQKDEARNQNQAQSKGLLKTLDFEKSKNFQTELKNLKNTIQKKNQI